MSHEVSEDDFDPVAELIRPHPGTPKGRLFPVSRDDLIECTALLRAVRRGELDRIVSHDAPLDVLAQQIVAETACVDYNEDDLYALVRRAWPYRDLERSSFDAVL